MGGNETRALFERSRELWRRRVAKIRRKRRSVADDDDRPSVVTNKFYISKDDIREALGETGPEQRSPYSMPVKIPPKLARVLVLFPPKWRPWLLLGTFAALAIGAWQAGMLGALFGLALKMFGVP